MTVDHDIVMPTSAAACKSWTRHLDRVGFPLHDSTAIVAENVVGQHLGHGSQSRAAKYAVALSTTRSPRFPVAVPAG